MSLKLSETGRPFLDARRMTNIGLAIKGEKKKNRRSQARPKPRQKQNFDVSPTARLAYQIHEARRTRYLREINESVAALGGTAL